VNFGIGKTLTLSYLAWNNWFFKKRKIATNYNLYGIPHYRIKTIGQFFNFIPEKETEEDILKGEEKWFGGDDFWRWVSSQAFGLGSRKKKELIERILMASRKAFVTVNYTTQLFSLIPSNIKNITDLVMKPILSPDQSYCKVYVFGLIEGHLLQPMQPFYFNTEPIYAIYNTYERVAEVLMDNEGEAEPELVENNWLIENNSAWKRYCINTLNIKLDSEEFMKKNSEVMEGLKRGL
jgi:hypothetical protein